MVKRAFKDNADGVYRVDITEGGEVPSWLSGMTELTEAEIDEAFPAPQITAQDIITERERRLALGFDYDFEDERGVHHIGTTPEDLKGWDEVTKLSQAAMAVGINPTIGIVTDTGPADVTATEWQSVLIAAGQSRQPIFAASFALQAADPIPDDFKTSNIWP
ncbi:hypothetical protein [uncultured Hoeflea sp.]|uniref:hypothetical protein n=1 Tax=uncultured Hoeflea sp. TaxID=538666 RepID=UPI0030DA2B02|tara:strand:+ start:39 stop:524 length:486 start_codon:yes stop_codon:yes gene_type:complete